MIGLFHLRGLEDRFPAEISGGQKQRVALARALIGRPDALLLDEPFSALDHPIRLEMIRLLKEVRNEFNLPVVLVTHDVLEAYAMADKIIVYSGGKIVRTGSPGEIFHFLPGWTLKRSGEGFCLDTSLPSSYSKAQREQCVFTLVLTIRIRSTLTAERANWPVGLKTNFPNPASYGALFGNNFSWMTPFPIRPTIVQPVPS